MLINIENGLRAHSKKPYTNGLNRCADALEGLLLNRKIEQPTPLQFWITERTTVVCQNINMTRVLQGALADLCAGEICIVSGHATAISGNCVYVGVYRSELKAYERVTVEYKSPFADRLAKYHTSQRSVLQQVATIADRRTAGQAMDDILVPHLFLTTPEKIRDMLFENPRITNAAIAQELRCRRQTVIDVRRQMVASNLLPAGRQP